MNTHVRSSKFQISVRRVIKKFLGRYSLVRFIESKSLSVGHLILFEDIGSVKSMRSCLVACVKHF